ncbi:MAG: DUF3943 domain-containing protein, partial [Prevotellaceae bacterium]|nr:DUF3943 domain-containing protein [Prevotellaceae bacterium]
MKRFILGLIGFFAVGATAAAQVADTAKPAPASHALRTIAPFELPTSVRRPWRAAAQATSINIGINLFDRWALDAYYARVTGASIRKNLKHQFLWDNDNFSTNLFWHPYTGGLYFNAARANGHSFWQAVPFAVGGSYMWEVFCETQPPSINDIIATPVGGIAFGEITHRVSHLFLDDSHRGWSRFGREMLAGIISPMDFFNRLLNGDVGRYRPRPGDATPTIPFSQINLSVATRFIVDVDKNRSGLNMAFSAGIVYGEVFADKDTHIPYDFFTAKVDATIIGNQPFLSNASIVGMLWGREWETPSEQTWLAGIFQHYDYYHARPVVSGGAIPYEFAETASFGGGMLFRIPIKNRRATLFGHVFMNGILLGASESDYYFVDRRNYNMGNGYSMKFAVAVAKKRWSVEWNAKLYQIFTSRGYGSADIEINGLPDNADADYVNAQGNKGHTLLGIVGIE